ncbi:hypothetical protein D3C78_1203040 [compost metagenome]
MQFGHDLFGRAFTLTPWLEHDPGPALVQRGANACHHIDRAGLRNGQQGRLDTFGLRFKELQAAGLRCLHVDDDFTLVLGRSQLRLQAIEQYGQACHGPQANHQRQANIFEYLAQHSVIGIDHTVGDGLDTACKAAG